MQQDQTKILQEQVREALQQKQGLRICGGGSKQFLNAVINDNTVPLRLSGHSGIVKYEPRELVLTARAGTTLMEIEEELAQAGQMLPFEPPHFGAAATLGGTIACNLSGPRRAYAGAARDFILGCRIINGKGEVLRFGGEVMKNVAGYDVSRLMAGAMGTLGVVLEVSIKVLPRPAAAVTLVHGRSAPDALQDMNRWAGRPYPISAGCYHDGRLYTRLEGAASSVSSAARQLGGEIDADGDGFWEDLREQRHGFFSSKNTLWRLSMKSTAPVFEDTADWMFEWAGARRWTCAEIQASRLRDYAASCGGHAMQFRHADAATEINHPLDRGPAQLHERLKLAFDPERIFNPGRLYPGL